MAEQFKLFDNNWKHNYTVYKLTDPNGLVYIGISRYGAVRRWKFGNGYKGNKRLDSAIREYSFASFKKEILAENLYRDDAERLEAKLIAKYNSTNPDKGYNVKSGLVSENWDVYLLTFPDGKRYVGMTGVPVELRWNYGHGFRGNKRLFAAIRLTGWKNIKKEHFAYPLSRDSAERIEATLIEWFDTTNPEKGYNRGAGGAEESGWSHGAGTKERISAALAGRRKTPETKLNMRKAQSKRPVRCMETGKIYDGVRIAAEEYRVSPSGITRACEGRQSVCSGLHWEYL